MPRGRRPGPGSTEERAAARREKVRLNVQAFRRRKQGLKDGSGVDSKPSFKWVEDTKWQVAYDKRQQPDEPDGPDELDDLDNTDDFDNQHFRHDSTGSNVTRSTSISASTAPTSPHDTSSIATPVSTDLVLAYTPSYLISPDHEAQDRLALLSIFPSRFLPSRISLPSSSHAVEVVRTPCALWVTTAFSLAKQRSSGPLTDVLLAITTALASMELNRNDLQVTSGKLYQRSLSAMRKQLQPIIEDKQSLAPAEMGAVFLACHAASVFELYVNGSFDDMNRHVHGIGLLINHQRNFPGFPGFIGDSLLEEYRMLEMNFCFMDRRLSTLNPNALNPPALAPIKSHIPTPKPGTSIFTTLLDISDYIPLAMTQIDNLKQFRPSIARDRQIEANIQSLLLVQQHIELWSRYLQSKCISGNSPSSTDGIDLPDNEIDVASIRSYDFACSWMFCLSYDNYALEEAVEAASLTFHSASVQYNASDIPYTVTDLRGKLIASTGKLAQLMQYFFQEEQGIIGRSLALWPLEACWNALDSERRRLQTDAQDLSLDDEDDDSIETENERRKKEVDKYLGLCREAAKKGRKMGLPLMRERS